LVQVAGGLAVAVQRSPVEARPARIRLGHVAHNNMRVQLRVARPRGHVSIRSPDEAFATEANRAACTAPRHARFSLQIPDGVSHGGVVSISDSATERHVAHGVQNACALGRGEPEVVPRDGLRGDRSPVRPAARPAARLAAADYERSAISRMSTVAQDVELPGRDRAIERAGDLMAHLAPLDG